MLYVSFYLSHKPHPFQYKSPPGQEGFLTVNITFQVNLSMSFLRYIFKNNFLNPYFLCLTLQAITSMDCPLPQVHQLVYYFSFWELKKEWLTISTWWNEKIGMKQQKWKRKKKEGRNHTADQERGLTQGKK